MRWCPTQHVQRSYTALSWFYFCLPNALSLSLSLSLPAPSSLARFALLLFELTSTSEATGHRPPATGHQLTSLPAPLHPLLGCMCAPPASLSTLCDCSLVVDRLERRAKKPVKNNKSFRLLVFFWFFFAPRGPQPQPNYPNHPNWRQITQIGAELPKCSTVDYGTREMDKRPDADKGRGCRWENKKKEFTARNQRLPDDGKFFDRCGCAAEQRWHHPFVRSTV